MPSPGENVEPLERSYFADGSISYYNYSWEAFDGI